MLPVTSPARSSTAVFSSVCDMPQADTPRFCLRGYELLPTVLLRGTNLGNIPTTPANEPQLFLNNYEFKYDLIGTVSQSRCFT